MSVKEKGCFSRPEISEYCFKFKQQLTGEGELPYYRYELI